jgi:hypothetical protein
MSYYGKVDKYSLNPTLLMTLVRIIKNRSVLYKAKEHFYCNFRGITNDPCAASK